LTDQGSVLSQDPDLGVGDQDGDRLEIVGTADGDLAQAAD
jgi:hypothetical protein